MRFLCAFVRFSFRLPGVLFMPTVWCCCASRKARFIFDPVWDDWGKISTHGATPTDNDSSIPFVDIKSTMLFVRAARIGIVAIPLSDFAHLPTLYARRASDTENNGTA